MKCTYRTGRASATRSIFLRAILPDGETAVGGLGREVPPVFEPIRFRIPERFSDELLANARRQADARAEHAGKPRFCREMIENMQFQTKLLSSKNGFLPICGTGSQRQRQNCLNFVSALAKVLFSN